MTADPDKALRQHLVKLLAWQDAHAGFDAVVAGIPSDLRGERPKGLPYSPWQLLEHMRLTQWDILAFCRDPHHVSPEWPDGYWPQTPAPPTAEAWTASVARFRADRQQMIDLISDPATDLFAKIPHGQGQTFLREALLVADHNSYHLGQMVTLRRLLGAWPAPDAKGAAA